MSELLEQPNVVFEKNAQVVKSVAKHGDAFDAEPEGKARVALGVDAARLEHVRMNEPCA